jgi:hypothetical protein
LTKTITIPPAKIVPTSEINHSGELKPQMETPKKKSFRNICDENTYKWKK